MQIGYIGLGSQGAGIAEMIARSDHQLILWARRPGVVDPFLALGAEVAATPVALAEQCDILGTCVMADADVLDLAEGQGVLARMRPGSVFVNQATISPLTARRLGEVGARHGVRIVDAPVSGSSSAARDGTLLILASGGDDAIDAALPMFDTCGKVVRCGALGAGQTAKLINNSVFYANAELVTQALRLAAALGIAEDIMRTVLASGSGSSFAANVQPSMIDPRGAAHIAALAAKDVGLLDGLVVGVTPPCPDLHRVAGHLVETIGTIARGHD